MCLVPSLGYEARALQPDSRCRKDDCVHVNKPTVIKWSNLDPIHGNSVDGKITPCLSTAPTAQVLQTYMHSARLCIDPLPNVGHCVLENIVLSTIQPNGSDAFTETPNSLQESHKFLSQVWTSLTTV